MKKETEKEKIMKEIRWTIQNQMKLLRCFGPHFEPTERDLEIQARVIYLTYFKKK